MDSVNEITPKVQQNMTTSQNSLNEKREPCPHGEMVRQNDDGSLCLWECSQCCAEEEYRNAVVKERSKREANYYRVMSTGSNYGVIPKRFRLKTLENYVSGSKQQQEIKTICQKYLTNFAKVREQGASMVFCGRPGTGKTHLAYAIVNRLQKDKVTAVVRTASDMTSEIKEAFRSDMSDVTPTSVTARFANFDLLVIDEVGIQVSSEAEKRIFFDIINKRYENMLPTILISNLALQELTIFVGERVIDRMKENGGIVFAFDWGSYRKHRITEKP